MAGRRKRLEKTSAEVVWATALGGIEVYAQGYPKP
jgi:hypothetical protein